MTTLEIDVELVDAAQIQIETPSVEATPSAGDTVLLVATPGPPGPPGPPGEGVPVYGEAPAGLINGTNAIYTTAQAYRDTTTAVYLNGLREFDYTETGATTITFSEAPHTGDDIRIDYIIE